MPYRRIADHVEPNAQSAQSSELLVAAVARMRSHGLAFLPVVDQGLVRGVLTEQDVARVESLPDLSLAQLTAADVMSQGIYSVTPGAPLAHVAGSMAQHDYSCVVVMNDGSVLGVLSRSDVLRLETEVTPEWQLDAAAAREVVLSERNHVHALLACARAAAQRLQESRDSPQVLASAHACVHRLLGAMRSLLDLEATVLAPALGELPGFGSERVRQLFDEHERQTKATESVLAALDDPEISGKALAGRLEHLMSNLRRALTHEERLLLHPDVLGGAGAAGDVEAG